MKKYRIHLNGKTYEMEIELIDEKELEKHEESKTFESAKPVSSSPVIQFHKEVPTQATQSEKENVVSSPMPGSITKIVMSLGDSVTKGQTVVILEAMKMENEITAPKDGKLIKLFVNQGDTVQGGAPLFEIE